jgi:PAS domain S-box-containing protein
LNPIGIGESIPAAQEPPVAHDDANMDLPQKIAAALTQLALSPGEEGLAGFLQSCAAYFLTLPGIQGALLAALDDEGTPYAVGHHHLLTGPDEPLVQTFSLIQEVIHKRSPGCWLDIPPTFCETEEGQRILTYFLDTASGCSGFLAVKIGEDDPSRIGTVDALSENAPLMALALQSATRGQAWNRFEQLQQLAQETLARQPWYFQDMVERLLKLFDAGAVTLLLREQEELRLSASTDPHLSAQRQVIYMPGEGLTGYVFQSGQAVRLSNTKDAEEVFRATGLHRAGPRFPERDHKDSPTAQFLGVPLRFGGRVDGVIRIVRRKGEARFTREDEKALQFFADALAAGLARNTSEVETQAEQHKRLLELLGAMKIAYFRTDREDITQESTSTDSDITGYSPEELRGISRASLYHDTSTRERLLQSARESHGHLRQVVHQMRRKNHEIFWAEGDLRILRDSMGREIGVDGLYRDVTDRIRLQGFINAETGRVLTDSELFDKLRINAELSLDYLSSLSHQLLTPLGSLIQTLRNFEQGLIRQKALQQRLPYVIGQVVVCVRLVRNLSYMDKILIGEPFEKQHVSLAKLATETKMDFLHLLEEKSLDIRINGESIERYVLVLGHQDMLRQVLVNLVDNAIKYSLPNTIIMIRGRKWPEGNALEISNEGLPLSVEQRERIFERGFRTQAARAIVPHGTGLGLWLARKIVEAHGATIRCLEVLEDGKKRILFRILFPNPIATRRSS